RTPRSSRISRRTFCTIARRRSRSTTASRRSASAWRRHARRKQERPSRSRTSPMPRYVAFLRAINVGGHIVKMDDLRRQFEKLGFTDVQTFIASGNVIFTSPSKDGKALERRIEERLEKAIRYEVRTCV